MKTYDKSVNEAQRARNKPFLESLNNLRGCGEMVYTLASGASGGNPVEVQVLSSAPDFKPALAGFKSGFDYS